MLSPKVTDIVSALQRSGMRTHCTGLALLRIFILSLVFLANTVSAYGDTLRLLVWEGYAPEPFRKSFETKIQKKYGRKVTLQVTHVKGSEDFFAAVRMKTADLVTLTHHQFKDERFNFIYNGLLQPIDTNRISCYKDIIPSIRNAPSLRNGHNAFGVPICQGLYALVYNTAKVKPVPKSWRILWAKEYKGTYVLGANEYLYNVCTAALAMGYPRESIAQFDKLNNAAFKQQLRALAVNAGGFWIGQDKPGDLFGHSLSAGWGDGLSILRKRGEDWQFAEPAEGSVSWVDSYAVTWALAEKPFLKQVAEEWIDFLLKPDFQVGHIVRVISQVPITTTVESELTEAEKKRLHVGDPDYFRKNHVLLPTCSSRDRNGLNLLWKEAMKDIKPEKTEKP